MWELYGSFFIDITVVNCVFLKSSFKSHLPHVSVSTNKCGTYLSTATGKQMRCQTICPELSHTMLSRFRFLSTFNSPNVNKHHSCFKHQLLLNIRNCPQKVFLTCSPTTPKTGTKLTCTKQKLSLPACQQWQIDCQCVRTGKEQSMSLACKCWT